MLLALTGVSDGLVGEDGDAACDRLRVDEPHGLLVARLAEKALTSSEHDGVEHQPQLVCEIVLDQRPRGSRMLP
jgi:hypothetical protein